MVTMQALMWAAILFWKEESDLLSLIYFGIEFQMFAPSYKELFFMLFVRGFGMIHDIWPFRLCGRSYSYHLIPALSVI
jgi:hypothetical protein